MCVRVCVCRFRWPLQAQVENKALDCIAGTTWPRSTCGRGGGSSAWHGLRACLDAFQTAVLVCWAKGAVGIYSSQQGRGWNKRALRLYFRQKASLAVFSKLKRRLSHHTLKRGHLGNMGHFILKLITLHNMFTADWLIIHFYISHCFPLNKSCFPFSSRTYSG